MTEPIEELLKQMSLAEPSRRLDKRVSMAVDGNHGSPPAWQPGWATVGVSVLVSSCAGLLAGLGIAAGFGRSGPEQSGSSQFAERERPGIEAHQGLATASTLESVNEQTGQSPVALSDDGLFLLNGTKPVRRYRATTVRRIETIDPHSGESRVVEIPVHQMIVTPSVGT